MVYHLAFFKDERLVLKIYTTLLGVLGPQGWWPHPTRFGKIVGALLAPAVKWSNVVRAIDNLEKAGINNFPALREVDIKLLEEYIRPSIYYRKKAQALKAMANKEELLEVKGSLLLREELLSLPNVGRETADSLLLYAWDYPIMVVDAYTKRVLHRYGYLSQEKIDYDLVQKLIESKLPKDLSTYQEYHALLVRLGELYCKKMPLCKDCPINKDCQKLHLKLEG